MKKAISVIWKKPGMTGRLETVNEGKLNISEFALAKNENRLEVELKNGQLDPGAFATIIVVRTENPFSFFARDVRKDMPIYVRDYEVIVTEADDKRTYEEIIKAITAEGRQTELERLESQPEENFEKADKKARNMRVPTWLGIGRDFRMFEAIPHQVDSDGRMWDTLAPKYHHSAVQYKEMGEKWIEYDYFAGRGIGHQYKLTRWLEDKVLPILNVCNDDGSVKYYQKIFVTLEKKELTDRNVRGTHFLVEDMYAAGSMRSPELQKKAEELRDGELYRDEETVAYIKVEAVNVSSAPKYCFMRLPSPNVHGCPELSVYPIGYDNGCSYFTETGRVFMVSTLNGKPFTQTDSSVLLAPGEKATYICKIPHSPISKERAIALLATDYDEKLAECKKYWQKKLDRVAQIKLPDKRIEEMMKAGFLHFDLVCFGKNPSGTVTPVVGVYGPIGTESTPIIQYLESIGDNKLAARAIDYFVKKQLPSGFIQNFGGYMSETGPAIWNMAEHFKYTHDIEYLKSVKDSMIRACDYIKQWMDQYRDESLRGKGYGMISGKVADCEKPFQSFMLNAGTYGGLKSVAEVLEYIDKAEAKRIGAIAEDLRKNIIESLSENIATSPVIPLSDGSWCPSMSLWPNEGNNGPLSLFAHGGIAYTHGSMVIQDGLLGGDMYMVMNGVLPADHQYIKFMRDIFTETFAVDNVGYSQPYYGQQPYGNIIRGEVGAYISEFYNLVACMADRETYTFWEHTWQCSPHKTHEEGWFMMRCRWMLYMDEFGRFDLLGAVPRAWLKDGEEIVFDGMMTRYGKLSVKVRSDIDHSGKIAADIKLVSNGFACPKEISIRLPHPEKRKAVKVSGGKYCPDCEKVFIEKFNGEAHVEVEF